MKKQMGMVMAIVVFSALALGMLSINWVAVAGSIQATIRISVASDGTESNGTSWGYPAPSYDGRYVTFQQYGTQLVPSDTSGYADVFVRDQVNNQTMQVSVNNQGQGGNGDSIFPDISATGQSVAFHSYATNFVLSDTTPYADVYVHDFESGETQLVSIASDGTLGNFESTYPSISGDGRYVSFHSYASNLVPTDTNGGWLDVFLHDRVTGETQIVSSAPDGTAGNGDHSWHSAISGDGRYIAFASNSSNLVPNDTNHNGNNSSCGYCNDVFVHDRVSGETIRVSVASDGTESNNDSFEPEISYDGRYIVFRSAANNLVPNDTNNSYDIFVHDRLTGQTTLASVNSAGEQANSYSEMPAISSNGRYVVFKSIADNLVPGGVRQDCFLENPCPNIFVHDRLTGETRRASISSTGEEANNYSDYPLISADGRFVTFASLGSNLVPNDTNNTTDIFAHNLTVELPTPTATRTGTATRTPLPTRTPSQTATASPTRTPTHTPTVTPTYTSTPSPTATRTATSSPTRTVTASLTSSATASITATLTAISTQKPVSYPVYLPLIRRTDP